MTFNPLEVYFEEAGELLLEIEQLALRLTAGDSSRETIHALFRAFHTIKGSGSMCGLDRVAGFTHHVETLLDRARDGHIAVSPPLLELVLGSADHITTLLAGERTGTPVAADAGDALVERLRALAQIDAPSPAATPAPPAVTAPVAPDPVTADGDPATAGTWQIRFRPASDFAGSGAAATTLFRDLRDLGPCEVTAHHEEVPALDGLTSSVGYTWWDIALQTTAGHAAIRDAFIFVENGAELTIEPAHATVVPVVPAVTPPAGSSPPAATAVPTSAPKPAADGLHKALATESMVRVPAARLDRLVNLVGELVMNQSRLTDVAARTGVADLANPVQEIERLVAELRDDVLGIRMLPIGTLFSRFRRLVHDLSAELGKQVDLVTEGDETELDKSILDQLGEPLVHMIRNAIDHGIERPDERAAGGKPRRGTVRLAAAHTGSDVVVSIADDGKGINRAAVRAHAVEKQLISADANPSDAEILNLLLLPGFSTARQVTSVSGRGVGMDVVKRQIDKLHGTLSIASEEGRGSRMSLTLPLTLAIIEGLLVDIGPDQFILPMAAVTETVELTRAERARNNGRNVIEVRGDLVPYVDVRGAFAMPGEPPPVSKIVIVRHDADRVGLVVDRVLGTHQTVIQSLGRFFRTIDVVSGATVMGTGRIALILDVGAIVRFADQQTQAERAA